MNVGYDPYIDKEYILKRVSQEEIFEKYLGIEVQTKSHFCSPIRPDEYPTCTFSYHNGKLWYRDWAENRPYDCFGIVMKIYNLNFPEALNKIASDFDLIGKDKNPQPGIQFERISNSEGGSSPRIIEVKGQDFTEVDVNYLSQYEISRDATVKFNVTSIYKIWLDNNHIYTYSVDDPALGYYFGYDNYQHWKIYFYKRDDWRFLCNTNKIQGYQQLPMTGDNLVITKSLKDVMSMWEFGITSIAPQSEAIVPDQEVISELQQRFDNLYSLYDFDRMGISTANKMRKQYGIPPLFFTNGRFGTRDYGVKDFSDYVKENSNNKVKNLIDEFRKNRRKTT